MRAPRKSSVVIIGRAVTDRLLTGRLAVTIAIENDNAGGLSLSVKPVDVAVQLIAPQTMIVLTLWAEPGDTVRARLEHLATGSTSYVQGNATLLDFAEGLGLRLIPRPDLER